MKAIMKGTAGSRHVLRLVMALTYAGCVASLAWAGFFISDALGRISNPSAESTGPVHVVSVNDAALTAALKAQADKGSADKKLQEPIANPFAVPPPPVPTTPAPTMPAPTKK